MRKYTNVEKIKVLSPESHEKIAEGLNRISKQRIEGLNDKEKDQVLEEIDEDGITT